MIIEQPYSTTQVGFGVAPAAAAGVAASNPVTAIVGVVGLAFTLFSGIAAKNQAIIDGLIAEKNQIKMAQEEIRRQLIELRNIRDGLRSEKAWLLGDRARKIAAGEPLNGLGLFKSRQVKKAQVRLTHHEELLDMFMKQANEYNNEISVLAGEVQSLRAQLGVREDEPLTKLEAAMKAGQFDKKYIFIALGLLAVIAVVAVVKKKKDKE